MIDPMLAVICFAGAYAGSALWGWFRKTPSTSTETSKGTEGEDGHSTSNSPYRTPGVIDNLLSTIERGSHAKSDAKTCVGYVIGTSEMMDDCKARQSDACEDGRCSFHCAKMCKCGPTVTHVSERAVWRK